MPAIAMIGVFRIKEKYLKKPPILSEAFLFKNFLTIPNKINSQRVPKGIIAVYPSETSSLRIVYQVWWAGYLGAEDEF